jgi:hypothetical protein
MNSGPCRKCGAASWSPQHRCNSAVRTDKDDTKTFNFGAMHISPPVVASAANTTDATSPQTKVIAESDATSLTWILLLITLSLTKTPT